MGWNQVRWAEAQQVAALMGVDDVAMPAPGVTPETHYATLRAGEEPHVAVSFLGHALPRMEAIAWAGRIVEEAARARQLNAADRQALDHALRWLGEPGDATRRAAMDAAMLAGERSPERMLATSVFFSGGSISEPDLPPIQPAPELAGRLAAMAIVMAAAGAASRDEFLTRALDLGEKVASDGARALEAA